MFVDLWGLSNTHTYRYRHPTLGMMAEEVDLETGERSNPRIEHPAYPPHYAEAVNRELPRAMADMAVYGGIKILPEIGLTSVATSYVLSTIWKLRKLLSEIFSNEKEYPEHSIETGEMCDENYSGYSR